MPLIDIMKLKPSETCLTSKHITDTKKIKDAEKRKRISFLEEEPIYGKWEVQKLKKIV